MGKSHWRDNHSRVEIKVLREREVNGTVLKKARIHICVFVTGTEDCVAIAMVEKVIVQMLQERIHRTCTNVLVCYKSKNGIRMLRSYQLKLWLIDFAKSNTCT